MRTCGRRVRSATASSCEREGAISFVDVDQIDWVEAEGNYVRLYIGAESHLVRDTMNGVLAPVEAAIASSGSTARGSCASIESRSCDLASGGDYDVVLHNGVRLGLSRLYKDDLQGRLANGR